MNIKTIFVATATIASSIFFTSCGETMKSAELAKTLKTSNTYDGKQIELVGKIDLYHELNIEADSTLSVGLRTGMGDNIEIIGFHLRFGKTKNSIFIITKADGTYDKGDISIYDNTGAELKTETEVKVKGTVHYTPENPNSKIHSTNKFAYTISDITIEKNK